jgi:hypothetical protein
MSWCDRQSRGWGCMMQRWPEEAEIYRLGFDGLVGLLFARLLG